MRAWTRKGGEGEGKEEAEVDKEEKKIIVIGNYYALIATRSRDKKGQK